MFHFKGRCPHCGSDQGFTAFGVSGYVITQYDATKIPAPEWKILYDKCQKDPLAQFSLAGQCQNCKMPVVATCQNHTNCIEEIKSCILSVSKIGNFSVNVLRIYPSPAQPYSHPSIPEAISVTFIDIQRMHEQAIQPHLIISGCRGILEKSLDELGAEGQSIYAKIEDLFSKGLITSTLKDWAHVIRRLGNAGTHEMAGNREEADELVSFTKVFLQYAFEMPAMIAALRNQDE